MTIFSERLKTLRKEKKLNQTALANLLEVSQNQISRYEKSVDMPPLHGLITLTKYFNVTIDYLLGLSSNKDIEKAWSQNLIYKRLSLFNQPDGEFEFPYFHEGKEKKSTFTYSFGILPLQHTDFMPIFFVIHEKEGNFMELATGYERIKEPDRMIDGHYDYISHSYSPTFSKTNFSFLSFINFLNSTFHLGYRANRESNGMHRIQLITTLPSHVPSLPHYVEIKSGDALPVRLGEIIYSKFLHDQYLPLSSEEKVKFLEPYLDEAFKW